MTDDLRDRIAAVLYNRAMSRLAWHRSWDDLQSEVQQMWLEDADAVMGLFTEECRNGPIVGSRDMLTRTGYKVARHRYVTEWETND